MMSRLRDLAINTGIPEVLLGIAWLAMAVMALVGGNVFLGVPILALSLLWFVVAYAHYKGHPFHKL